MTMTMMTTGKVPLSPRLPLELTFIGHLERTGIHGSFVFDPLHWS